MEDFKKIIKMRTGGSVSKAIAAYEKRERKTEESADIAQDKKIIKKAIGMHDKQEHKGEKTDLSKLKKGGRAKKEIGTARKFIKPAKAPSGAKSGPNKYKTGGSVTNVYEAKKKSGDIDAIEAVKNIKATKANAPSKAAVAPKNTPAKFCGGKSVKKMAMGGIPAAAPSAPIGQGAVSELEKRRALEKMARAKQYLGPAQQSELIKQSPGAAGLTGNIGHKKGGKIKKCADGGSIDDDVRTRAMKWIESGSPEPVTPVAPVKPVRRAKPVAAKLPMPDYSNEDLDKMDAAVAEKTRRSKRTPRQMLEEESEYTVKPELQAKGERLMKGYGMKRGGKACK